MATHLHWLTIVLVGLIVAGCNKATDDPTKQASDKGQVEKKSENQKPKDSPANTFAGVADLSLTADELGKEQNKNEKGTQTKYKGKVIELTGIVLGMGRNLFLEPGITLKVKDEIVQLYLTATDPRPWDKALPGQRVKLKVIYQEREKGIDTRLLGGPILEVTGKPTPTITAEEMGKEYQKDPKEAEKKYRWSTYDQKPALIITGEISEAMEGDGYTTVPVFYLKTGTKFKLKCGPDRESARGLKPGMRVEISGLCFGFEDNKTDIKIVDCLVMKTLK